MNGKRYSRYVDDFINSHRYINCNNAVCRNCHEMNIHIVKGLLNECAHLVQSLFAASDFSFEKCMELRRLYDRSEPLPPTIRHYTDGSMKVQPLSFGCNFTQEQMTGIVFCANTLRFRGLLRGYGSSLFLQRGLSYPSKQSPSCGYPFRCASRKLIHPIPLAVCSGQRAVPAIQRWCTVHHRFQSFIGSFCRKKQQDIGRLWNKKSHQGIGIIKR